MSLGSNASTFNCTECGAEIKFKAGTKHLECAHCGNKNEIKDTQSVIQEIDYQEYLRNSVSREQVIKVKAHNCSNCGATSTVDSHLASDACPYCATPFVLESAKDEEIIKPKNLLPFTLDKNQAVQAFRKWIKSLWFAPNSLSKSALNPVSFKGIYLPYWTYDSDTHTIYTGARGDDYYVTVGSGKDEKKEKRTRWTPVSGEINQKFDDVLIPATKSVSSDRLIELEPWDLSKLVNYDENFLSGFRTECYAIDLENGFGSARIRMATQLRSQARRQIGGDRQEINTFDTRYSDVTFKHILLPLYVCAYRHGDKLYNFVVNAQTGEVKGDRPYSLFKIIALILGILGIAALLYILQDQGYFDYIG